MKRSSLLMILMLFVSTWTLHHTFARTLDDDKPGAISGTLVDKDGKPINGFNITLQQKVVNEMNPGGGGAKMNFHGFEKFISELKVVGRATTDKDGNFKFEKLKPGAYLIIAGNKGVGFLYERVAVNPGEESKVGSIKLKKRG